MMHIFKTSLKNEHDSENYNLLVCVNEIQSLTVIEFEI